MPTLPADLETQVRTALAEDIQGGDLTAQLVPAEQQAKATILTREAAVICGQPWVDRCFHEVDKRISVQWRITEGAEVAANTILCDIEGPARGMLTAERTALNFLQTLSGTATTAHRFAALVEGTGCRILDTRKTLPGLRTAQKYAVAVGGCSNHRMGLFDAILIKENHIAAAGGIAAAITTARRNAPGVTVEVEVESLAELDEALAAGADIIMLDEFSLPDTRQAVDRSRGRAKLEASGGIDAARIREIAAIGVDFISVGALTKHLAAIDLSMRIQF